MFDPETGTAVLVDAMFPNNPVFLSLGATLIPLVVLEYSIRGCDPATEASSSASDSIVVLLAFSFLCQESSIKSSSRDDSSTSCESGCNPSHCSLIGEFVVMPNV